MATKPRSPNHPRLSLEAAIEALQGLYRSVRTNEFNDMDAAKSWGRQSTSGATRANLSALRQYGLIEGKRGLNPKISRIGQILAVRAQTSGDYQGALRHAALAPSLFKELHETKPNATDEVLRGYLLLDKNFTETGAAKVLEVYRDTMKLAQIGDVDAIDVDVDDEQMSRQEEDISPYEEDDAGELSAPPVSTNQISPTEGMVRISLIGSRGSATFELPTPVPAASWDQMIGMISALKPIYVQEEKDK